MNSLEKHLDHYPDVEIFYYCREVSSISSRYPSYTNSCYTLARLPPISLTYLLCCNTTDLFLYLIYTFFAYFATGQ